MVAPSGARYVQLPQPYQGFWLLDRTQFWQFIHEPNGQWRYGARSCGCGVRERVACGWSYVPIVRRVWRWWWPLWSVEEAAYVGRALAPITADGRLDPLAAVHHLPDNYAAKPAAETGLKPIDDLLAWGGDGSGRGWEVALTQHPGYPCAKEGG